MHIIQILITSFCLSASTLGLLDSGADPHIDGLFKHLRENKIEEKGRKNRDDDNNGYIDDIYGWNFIEENPDPFNSNLRGHFESVFYKYYKIREKKALETWTEEEESWYKQIRKDEDFLEKLKKFRSFIHGSHVVGIAMRRDHRRFGPLNFINVKYLGKAEKGAAKEPEYRPLKKGSDAARLTHLKKYIDQYNTWQAGKLDRAISYLSPKAHVINGSWGKSFKGSVKVVGDWYEQEFEKEPSDEQGEELARFFLSRLMVKTKNVLKSYPHILFVFSAGNSKADNDEFPHYPSDVRLPNVMAVGASMGSERTSSSNYGKNNVDLFAPGFLIPSLTPDNKIIKTTGTSQAAPRVSHSALVIRNINKKLRPSQIKEILLRTVDKGEAFISVSGGHLNLPRAIEAAKLSSKLPLAEAIQMACKKVGVKLSPKGFKSLKSLDEELPEPF